MINVQEKQSIATSLEGYVNSKGSQNKASKILGVSPATLSQIKNNNWDLINNDMSRNIAAQIGWTNNTWQGVETRDFKLLQKLLADAQMNSGVFAAVGSAGSGKTFALKHYAANNQRAYLLQCNEFWNRKYFLADLLRVMGRDQSGLTVSEMMYEVVKHLKMQDRPIIIMDEADKLSDQVLYFFITLYNQLEDQCGIILCATDHLEKRINKGLNLNKKGYKEIFSRIGRKFIELKGVTTPDVSQICQINNITDKKVINKIFADSEDDLRRVKRMIHAHKMIQKQTAQ